MIVRAELNDLEDVASISLKLWTNHKLAEMLIGYAEVLKSNDDLVVLDIENDSVVGFAHVSTRHDYVEGTNGGAIAYLEGIYVSDDYRNQGIASKLIKECEAWSNERGISEFASDCELENYGSEKMHLALGFKEVNVIRCFVKKIK